MDGRLTALPGSDDSDDAVELDGTEWWLTTEDSADAPAIIV